MNTSCGSRLREHMCVYNEACRISYPLYLLMEFAYTHRRDVLFLFITLELMHLCVGKVNNNARENKFFVHPSLLSI